ncbi:MAG: hypothetical protein GY712_04870 [Oceanicoccus sp.]|uniref:hypothetical protein n=1 Tax=Oceanicoccus sp. TaxID=2691044 RepID=UPI002617E285|nr:hypothetical protein [Oceanicoccus sp.]MCP3907331.1 hypothetical protein [Oceanicoccus sp.]
MAYERESAKEKGRKRRVNNRRFAGTKFMKVRKDMDKKAMDKLSKTHPRAYAQEMKKRK